MGGFAGIGAYLRHLDFLTVKGSSAASSFVDCDYAPKWDCE